MLDGITLEEALDILKDNGMKETPLLFRCMTDADTLIIPAKDVVCMKPIVSQDGDPYIRIEYEDSEFKTICSIYCSEVEFYSIN